MHLGRVRLPGPVFWCLRWRDLFAPALSLVGLHADRVIQVEAGSDTTVPTAMEECQGAILRASLAAFARTGSPQIPSLPEWRRSSAAERACMVLDIPPRSILDPDRTFRDFWEAGRNALRSGLNM